MRLTRCDVCNHEVPPGRGGFRVERLDNALTAPVDHGYWDACSLKCLTELAETLSARDETGRI